MNVTQQGLFYFTTGIDIVHIGIQNSFEHHSRVIGRTPEAIRLSVPIIKDIIKLCTFGCMIRKYAR